MYRYTDATMFTNKNCSGRDEAARKLELSFGSTRWDVATRYVPQMDPYGPIWGFIQQKIVNSGSSIYN